MKHAPYGVLRAFPTATSRVPCRRACRWTSERIVVGAPIAGAALAMILGLGLYVTLPTKFVAGGTSAGIFGAARWFVAALVLLLLVLLVLTAPRLRLVQVATSEAAKLRASRRIASIGVIALISLANATAPAGAYVSDRSRLTGGTASRLVGGEDA